MKTHVFPLPRNDAMAAALAGGLGAPLGASTVRRFPDGESYVRLEEDVREGHVILVCTLDDPDEKLLPLLYFARLARDLGADRVGLVAPYLAYMRQDRRFEPGEAVTSEYFAHILSSGLDWLVTVDPHLHRHASLAELYDIPACAVHAAPLIARWIRANVDTPILVGPDSESVQWVSTVAEGANAPYTVLEKVRRGDRDVEVSIPDLDRWRNHTPVLVDDIVSTAHTMIETLRHLRRCDLRPPVCIAIHGLFAERAYEELREAGAAQIVTSNTIPHESNGIDLSGALLEAIKTFL